MDSLPSSKNGALIAPQLVFCDGRGAVLEAPREWEPAWIEVAAVPIEAWSGVRLWLGESEFEVSPRKPKGLGTTTRLLAEWPRQGPGNYILRAEVAGQVVERSFSIAPRKITLADLDHIVSDLEERLPASLAIALQQLGGFAGVQFAPASQSTLAEEFLRLRRAVRGIDSRPGLAHVLRELAPDPHRVLRSNHEWTPAERARRPHPAALALVASRPDNLFQSPLPGGGIVPRQVVDTRVEPSVDVHENRLVKAFCDEARFRLRRLEIALARSANHANLLKEVLQLGGELARARRGAAFLEEVASPPHLPDHVTMVLQRRPAYRAALQGYLELHRAVTVRIEEPRLDAPLQNLPNLYQVWATLQTVRALFDEAIAQGFKCEDQRLFRRDAGGFFLELVPDGQTLLRLRHPTRGTMVKLIPERSYGRKKPGALHSVSFKQRPDIVVEITEPGQGVRVFLFDPKYKLDSESLQNTLPSTTIEAEQVSELLQDAEIEDENEDEANSLPVSFSLTTAMVAPTGRPKKVDIDKMHTYRDAIRDADDRRVVEYAAILYPGQSKTYSKGLEALCALPLSQEDLRANLRDVLGSALVEAPPQGDADKPEVEHHTSVAKIPLVT